MPLERINWVDHAKGVCIVLIVAMYAIPSYGEMIRQTSWMSLVVAWTEPALLPAFFFLAALFLNMSVFGPTKHFVDRKILHFAYFYLIWLLIQKVVLDWSLIATAPLVFLGDVLTALVSPSDSLVLVYMLIVFHAVTRLLRFLPPQKVFVAAALLQIGFATGWVDTGWIVANQFAVWFVFFFAGFVAAPHVFEFADRIDGHAPQIWNVLLGWAVVNAAFVALSVSGLPLISLALGFAGTAAIIALSIQLCRFKWLTILRYAGRHCLIIYLTFPIPVVVLQQALAANGRIGDAGLACLVITLGGVAMPLILHRLVRATPLKMIYQRPRSLRLRNARNQSAASLLPPPPTSARNA
jgi:uncharacterized membrane protein YcfT